MCSKALEIQDNEILLQKADENLYIVKEEGRDRVCIKL